MQPHRCSLAIVATCLAVLGMTAGPAAAAIHDESGDAGQSRATAQPVTASPPTAIRGSVAPNSADMYRVCSAGGEWSATTSTERDDPMLWLFDAAGNQVAFNDDVPDREDFESAISGDAGAGVYYLAIAQYPYGRSPAHNADTWPTTDIEDATEMAYTINLEGFEACETQAPHITTSAKTADDQPYTTGDWTNQDVTVAFACVDNSGGSGVDEDASTLTASKTISDDGEHNVPSSGVCADLAGNTAEPVSYGPVRIDKTPPIMERTARTAPNQAGWNAGEVTVTWSCTDAASGAVEDTVSETVSSDGADQDASASCRDRAGNTASATEQHINIDTHNPHVASSATTADGHAYAASQWTNQSVMVAFACVDNSDGSGVDQSALTLIASKTVSAEGITDTVASSGECVDTAGNSAAGVSFGPVRIDKTGPVVKFTGERTYTVAERIEIGCSASDALSGIAVTCTGLSAPAGSYPPGTHTISRSATDKAANQTTRSATFTVKATPSSLCTLTTQFVQSSANYLRLAPIARKAVDKLTAAACQQLLGLVPGLSPPRKAALVTLYRAAVTGLATARWLTAEQASTLKTLAGTL